MTKLDRLALDVSERASREWYVNASGLNIACDVPEGSAAAPPDDSRFFPFIGAPCSGVAS